MRRLLTVAAALLAACGVDVPDASRFGCGFGGPCPPGPEMPKPCESGGCSTDADFVMIAAGRFTMGSPANEPSRKDDEVQHQVTITRAFWIQKTEVTQRQWSALMGTAPFVRPGCDDCPAEGVTWRDAVRYTNQLSAANGLPECYGGVPVGSTFEGLDCAGYRLPTEAEWELAARATSTTAYPSGAPTSQDGCMEPRLDEAAWYCGNAGGKPHPVATKAANRWGLFDTLGNVFEWTHDGEGPYPPGDSVDPIGPSETPRHAMRGGGFQQPAGTCRFANRRFWETEMPVGYLGVRPVRTVR